MILAISVVAIYLGAGLLLVYLFTREPVVYFLDDHLGIDVNVEDFLDCAVVVICGPVITTFFILLMTILSPALLVSYIAYRMIKK